MQTSIATVFSGVGTIEYALREMGVNHRIEFACDTDKYCKQSYFANYDISEDGWYDDIENINGNKHRGRVDIFAGGSPCQSFSAIGNREGLNDARGNLIFQFFRLVKQIQPRVFIYENVKGLLTHGSGKTFRIIENKINKLGYTCYKQVLDAHDYGIPQSRKRLFVIGFLKKRDFWFPDPAPSPLTMQDLLEENTDPKYFLSEKMVKHIFKRGAGNFNKDTRTDLPVARALLSTMGKMHRAGIDNYISKDGGYRRLTPRECFRLMGFKDDFKIVVSDTQAYKQAGNAIVVNVLVAILTSIGLNKAKYLK